MTTGGTNFPEIEAKRWYRPQDPALRLIGSIVTLYRLRKKGEGPHHKIVNGRVLYYGADLLEYIERGGADPASDA